MPAIIAAILQYGFIAAIVVKVLFAVGLSAFAIVGVDVLIDSATSVLSQYETGIGANSVWLLHNTGVSTVLSWILQAHAVLLSLLAGRLVIRGSKFLPGVGGGS